MKKILIGLIILFLGCNVFADTKQPTIKFNGTTYTLKYSSYSKATKSYMNEYFKGNENGDNWTDLIGVYYIKAYNKPLDYAKALATAASKQTPLDTQVMYNEKDNIAIANFMLIGETEKTRYLEQNIFKAEKPIAKKGIVAIQFAHKYPLNNKDEAMKMKAVLPENQKKWLESINKTIIPELVEKEIKTW